MEAVEEALAILGRYLAAAGRLDNLELSSEAEAAAISAPIDSGDRQAAEGNAAAPSRRGSQPFVPEGLPGPAAIRGHQTDLAGTTIGVGGTSAWPDGFGVGAANEAGGGDLLLDGTADGQTDAVVTQAGIDRSSATAETFVIQNTGGGGMTLLIDGVEAVTTATDQDTLGGLSCQSGEVAKTSGGIWMCDRDLDTDTLAALSCADGEVAKWDVGLGQWLCAPDLDSDTTYLPGNQLDLTGSTFNVVEGSGSGLDADHLDGQDSAAFMPATTDNWVDTTGDTMVGLLTTVDVELQGRILQGGQVLLHQPPGGNNTAVGMLALASNNTGYSNTASGSQALRYNTNGIHNTAVGHLALHANTDGDSNTAAGAHALQFNTTGTNNVATGFGALRANVDGSQNTASGVYALYLNTSGQNNTANGMAALTVNTTGSYNTATGATALQLNTTGHKNTAIDVSALQYNHAGNYNTA